MARKKAPEDTAGDVTLESAMTELADLVARMESGEETLDQSLSSFERGMQLLRICHQKLDQAAQQIEIVTQMSSDGVSTESFDSRSTMSRAESKPAARRKPDVPSDDDEGLLF